MEHFILQFFTGTMAFWNPQPRFWRNGAENPDAFLERHRPKRCKMQDKLQKVRIMQELCRMAQHTENEQETTPRGCGRKYAGESRTGGRERTAKPSGRGAHESATAKRSRVSTAMRREPGFGNRAEYTACGANGGGDEQSHPLEAGI